MLFTLSTIAAATMNVGAPIDLIPSELTVDAKVVLPTVQGPVNGVVTSRLEPGIDRLVLRGQLVDSSGARDDWFAISQCGDSIAGSVTLDGRLHRLDGEQAIDGDIEWTLGPISADGIDHSCEVLTPPVDDGPAQGSTHGPAFSGGCDDGTLIDVMLLYNDGAIDAAGGLNDLIADLDLWIAWSNQAYIDSAINASLRTVYIGPVGPGDANSEVGLEASQIDNRFDHFHPLRDAYGADLVAVITEGGGGVAFGLNSLDEPSNGSAFSLTRYNSGAATFTLTHEFGHNMGCCHAVGDGGGCGTGLLFEYSNGHRFFGFSGDEFRTVMAYSPGERLARFSNPSLAFDGVLTGIDPDDNPPGADNAATVNQSAPVVAARRCTDDLCKDLDLPIGDLPDCNRNGIPDACDLARGNSQDLNGDDIPDECICPNDVVFDGVVDIQDLVSVLANWDCIGVCIGDLNSDGRTGLSDLIVVLAAWGGC